ncbi:MAG: FAD-binding oxidoreductase, partial [Desulfobacterales bacterium]|nr:FAD-binding oxidoreductase [Desulfobacterales bacterium]
MITKEAEMVVLGGGVMGSCTAYFLSKAGKQVVLIEKGHIGGEASAANGAHVWTSTRRPGIDLELALASIEIHKQFGEELNAGTEYRRTGGIIIVEQEEQLPAIDAFRKEREKAGLILTPLSKKETRELEPSLSGRIVGGLWNPLDGGTNPFKLLVALNRKAAQMGAKIFYHTEVQGIRLENHRVKEVVTSRGSIRTNTVVNACGAWAPFIGNMVGIKIPIIPNRMEFIVTEQLPPLIFHMLMGASYVTEEYGKDEMIADRRRFGCGLSIHQTVSGNILLGSTWRFTGYDRSTSYEETVAIGKEVKKLLPSLRDFHVLRTFANFFPFTHDDLPILGYVEEIEGFIMAAGHSGHGICLGPITGKLVSEL